MTDQQWAQMFNDDWIASWNAHDMRAVTLVAADTVLYP